MIKIDISELSYKKIAVMIGALVLLTALGIWGFSARNTERASNSSTDNENFVEASFIKVTDGDTIWAEVGDSKKKVRLIGIDAPEMNYSSSGPDAMWGQQAMEFVRGKLSAGQKIYLQYDISGEDDYGRLLCYVWLEKPSDSDNDEEVRNKMLNAVILLNGYADAAEYEPDTKYSKLLEQYEAEAKDGKVGLWTDSEQ